MGQPKNKLDPNTWVYKFAGSWWVHAGEVQGCPLGYKVENGVVVDPPQPRQMMLDDTGYAFFDDNVMNVSEGQHAAEVWPKVY